MRFADGSSAGSATGARPASPYRVPAREAEGAGEPKVPVEALAVAIPGLVMACSLVRFAIFALRSEPIGLDPFLALVAAATSAYYLRSLLGR